MRPKKIKDPVRLSIVISKELHDCIKRAATHMSVSKGKPVTSSEAAREALEHVFPTPSKRQLGLF